MAVETKTKIIQETVIIEEGEKTLEDVIEEQRAVLHKEGKKVRKKIIERIRYRTRAMVCVQNNFRDFYTRVILRNLVAVFLVRRVSQCFPGNCL